MAIEIVKNNLSQTAIVIPDPPLPVHRYAAKELQYHIQKASGAVVAVIEESKLNEQPLPPRLIYLGSCLQTKKEGIDTSKLSANSFIIKTLANNLFIAGDDSSGTVLGNDLTHSGTLFGVYEFLEKQLHIKWLWPGELGEIIPPTNDIVVKSWDQTTKPKLIFKRWRTYGPTYDPKGWSSSKIRDQFFHEQNIWLKRQRFSIGENMYFGHSFTKFWNRFKDSHPEFFNLLPDGQRKPEPPHVSMCVAEPGLWKQIVKDWQDRRWPQNQKWIDASENDTPGKCTCPKCMSWDEPDPELDIPWNKRLKAATDAYKKKDSNWVKYLGRLSDRYAKFYLAVQHEAEKVDHENAVVMGLAYENYWKPPISTKLNDRIIIAIVPALTYPWTDKKRRDFHEQWLGWRNTGARLILRPNYMMDGHCYPIFFADKLGQDITFAKKNGLFAVDFDHPGGQWATQGPNLYMLARIINTDCTVDEILEEYYSAFGPAKEDVKAYFKHWKNVSDSVNDEFYKGAGGNWVFYPMAYKIFTPSVMQTGFAILARAKKSAANDKLVLQRLDFLEKGLRNAQLTSKTQIAYEKYKNAGNLKAFREAANKLDTYRANIEADFTNISNIGFLHLTEQWLWPRDLVHIRNRGKQLGSLWNFAFDTKDKGESAGWWEKTYDDNKWDKISINTVWGKTAVGKKWEDEHKSEYKGSAWYRSSFLIPAPASPKRYFLIFGAVHGACKIWVNGKLLLQRKKQNSVDSYLRRPFQIEITDVISFDNANTIAVEAKYTMGAGGIWKPVWLYEAEKAIPGKDNIMPNPSFEKSNPKTIAWKKSIMNGECQLSVDSKEKFSGKFSGKITCLKLKDKKAQARWYQLVPVKKGKYYQLRLWVKTSVDFHGAVAIWFRSGKRGKHSGNLSVNISPTDGLWQQIVLKNIVPQENKAAIYLNLTNGTGSVWFDDVELIEKVIFPKGNYICLQLVKKAKP